MHRRLPRSRTVNSGKENSRLITVCVAPSRKWLPGSYSSRSSRSVSTVIRYPSPFITAPSAGVGRMSQLSVNDIVSSSVCGPQSQSSAGKPALKNCRRMSCLTRAGNRQVSGSSAQWFLSGTAVHVFSFRQAKNSGFRDYFTSGWKQLTRRSSPKLLSSGRVFRHCSVA